MAKVTVRVVEPEMLPAVAVIVVEPTARHVASPVSLIVAIPVFDEPHVTDVVKSCMLLSEKVPVAVNCLVVPRPLVGLIGATSIDTRAFTVSVVQPDTPPNVAVMVVEPAATAEAKPFEPDALLIVATPVFDELHVANVVKSWVAPFDKVPLALNCWVVPTAMVWLTGVTTINATVSTVSVATPEIPPNVAVMVVEPVATAVARPEPLMIATPGSNELHVANAVKS